MTAMNMENIERAAKVIRESDAILITAGAGMGVDSGLPDFRGNDGFWRAYPAYAKLGLSFERIARGELFRTDPELAWGFYGHRLSLYRDTVPHDGFRILRKWTRDRSHFIVTSNVDGQFQRAFFSPRRIDECHGSIHHLQCTHDCGLGLIDASDYRIDVDTETMRARGHLPKCPRCKGLLRPNVMMFADSDWDPSRENEQDERFHDWLNDALDKKLVIVECGAGTTIPTIRAMGDTLSMVRGLTMVRINPREPEVGAGNISIRAGALEALSAIDELGIR